MDAHPPPAAEHCAVCEERQSEILHTTEHSLVIWGAGTYGSATKVGHLMVCPRRHVAGIGDLKEEESLDLMRCSCLAARVVYVAWRTSSSWPPHLAGPKGSYNLGFNFGPNGHDFIPVAQGLGHLHVHVVPRNLLDTNFMWWTTQSSILHLQDMGMRQRVIEEFQKRSQPGWIAPVGAVAPAHSGVPLLDPASIAIAPPANAGSNAVADAEQSVEPDFEATEPAEGVCPLCRETGDLLESALGRVLFSVKPYRVGHVMVIPRRHVATLEQFTEEEMVETARLIAIAGKLCCTAVGADSYSVGINVGPHSGASIPSHCHIHIIPRSALDGATSYWERAEAAIGAFYTPPQVREIFKKHWLSEQVEK